MYVKRGRAERSEETRGRLIDVGRRLFAERGFAATATEDLVLQAGVTRGALYHHFHDKRALFGAVFEQTEGDVAARLSAAAAEAGDPWQALRAAVQTFLDVCLDPAIQRITLIDAPAVLGWEAWRQSGARYALGLLQGMLSALIEGGYIEPQPVEPLAHLLLGALSEAGLFVASASDSSAARAAVGESLNRLFEGLRSHAR